MYLESQGFTLLLVKRMRRGKKWKKSTGCTDPREDTPSMGIRASSWRVWNPQLLSGFTLEHKVNVLLISLFGEILPER